MLGGYSDVCGKVLTVGSDGQVAGSTVLTDDCGNVSTIDSEGWVAVSTVLTVGSD